MAKTKVMKVSPTASKPSRKNRAKDKLLQRLRNPQKKKKISWRKPKEPRGVVYLSHIPHGFYEEQIQHYFSQFGRVTAVYHPRSKTGKSRGFAFVEFRHPEVAEIAAETMNNYLFCNRVLKAQYIPVEKQKPKKFALAKARALAHETPPELYARNVKHQRFIKNRHLKHNLEARFTVKLFRTVKQLKKKMEANGLTFDCQIEEAGANTVLKTCNEEKSKRKEKALKQSSERSSTSKNVSGQVSQKEPQNSEEDELSSLDGVEDLSFDDLDFRSDEDDEEIVNQMVAKAKNVAKEINQQKKSMKKEIKVKDMQSSSGESENEINLDSEKNVTKNNQFIPFSMSSEKNKSSKTVKSPLKNSKKRGKKKISKNTDFSFSVMSNQSGDVVMEVDEHDEEINFKTPPNVTKTFLKTEKGSVNKTPKQSKKQHSASKKTPTMDSPLLKNDSSKKTKRVKKQSLSFNKTSPSLNSLSLSFKSSKGSAKKSPKQV